MPIEIQIKKPIIGLGIPGPAGTSIELDTTLTQSGKTYLCNRDTGNPVYNALAELVGLYVTEV